MFLRDSPRPHVRAKILQRLGVADSLEWVAQYGFDEIEETRGCAAFGLNPVAEILDELRMEDRLPRGFNLQDQLSFAMRKPTLVANRLRALWPTRRANVQHSWVSAGDAPFL